MSQFQPDLAQLPYVKWAEIIFSPYLKLLYNRSFAQMCLLIRTVSHMSDVAQWPLVLINTLFYMNKFIIYIIV